MQTRHYGYRIVRISAILLIVLGMGVFFGFINNITLSIPWIVIVIAGFVVIMISSRSSSVKRNRKQHTYPNHKNTYPKGYNNEYEPVNITKESQDFIPSSKYKMPSYTDGDKYCNYCGIRLDDKAIFCVNCGTKRN